MQYDKRDRQKKEGNTKGWLPTVSSVRWSVLGALPWLPYGADSPVTPFHQELDNIIPVLFLSAMPISMSSPLSSESWTSSTDRPVNTFMRAGKRHPPLSSLSLSSLSLSSMLLSSTSLTLSSKSLTLSSKHCSTLLSKSRQLYGFPLQIWSISKNWTYVVKGLQIVKWKPAQ